MGCRFCVHWVSDDEKSFEINSSGGECRRYPKPERTIAIYRCGEFVCNPTHDYEHRGLNVLDWFYQQRNYYIQKASEEREKRLAEEKKLKSLRATIKSRSQKC
jgi:hypothetical protein